MDIGARAFSAWDDEHTGFDIDNITDMFGGHGRRMSRSRSRRKRSVKKSHSKARRVRGGSASRIFTAKNGAKYRKLASGAVRFIKRKR